jgi:2-hydroxychromene-2-carboxylate isomerase
MSLSSWLMPVISEHLLGQTRLQRQRERAERSRLSAGLDHQVHYFHQLDDPYSVLTAQCLQRLQAHYDIHCQPHVVGPPADALAPQRELLHAYSRVDAQRLAQRFGLNFHDPGRQPVAQSVAWGQSVLVSAIEAGRFPAVVNTVCGHLWACGAAHDNPAPSTAVFATAQKVQQHLQQSDRLRQSLGHGTGASFYYAGEWYWGVDRLHHLERRLLALGARRSGTGQGLLFPLSEDLHEPRALNDPPVIEFFFSLRSPYSAIVVSRVFELARLTGAPVRLRYVLPMVMRGLPVPRSKRMGIVRDAAREARARQIPFGRLNDPVGRPTERGLALMQWVDQAGRGPAYLQAFMQGVWAEGIDAGSQRGLRRIVERAGLNWTQAQAALHDPQWRTVAEDNRRELLAHGLWGVPSFCIQGTAIWGQDRLWAVEEALIHHSAQATVPAAAPA